MDFTKAELELLRACVRTKIKISYTILGFDEATKCRNIEGTKLNRLSALLEKLEGK